MTVNRTPSITQMSNKRLLRLIDKYFLTSSQVADIVRVQPVTVEHWRQTPGGTGYRVMPDGLLELLQIKLGEIEVPKDIANEIQTWGFLN